MESPNGRISLAPQTRTLWWSFRLACARDRALPIRRKWDVFCAVAFFLFHFNCTSLVGRGPKKSFHLPPVHALNLHCTLGSALPWFDEIAVGIATGENEEIQ